MYPKPLQNLIDLFIKLPGIGPRQAARFAFYILKEKELARNLSSALVAIDSNISHCLRCYKTIETDAINAANEEPVNNTNKTGPFFICVICQDSKRNPFQIAVVEKESDLENLEKAGIYHGHYHVLGGTISPVDINSPKNLHLKELHARVKNLLDKNGGKCEIVLATNPTTEGDTTALYIDRILSSLKDLYPDFKISRLGRGISLGTELEYADETTLRNALTNRK